MASIDIYRSPEKDAATIVKPANCSSFEPRKFWAAVFEAPSLLGRVNTCRFGLMAVGIDRDHRRSAA